MAFKIKSAKIFFWNKRTHSDVVDGSTLRLAEAATGNQQEEKTRRCHSCILRVKIYFLAKVTQGRTAVCYPEEAWLRVGEAAGFGCRETEVSLMVRLQSKLPL